MSEAVGAKRQNCDECGREVDKIHRVHKGVRYCVTCYARCFKRRMCPRCGNFARLLKSDPLAICRRCETKKPCARCGKVDYEMGKITPYGPVCNACAPHFREPKPCEACGSPSPKLSRVRRLGHDLRVCPKCAQADYGTCSACRRYRLLADGPDGKRLCKACLEKGEVPCPSCGRLMPAGHGKRCPRCYWMDLFEKRVRLDCAAFSTPTMASHFEAFGQWLIGQVGEHKAAITIHRYLPFFMEVEREWKAVPGYSALLEHFGAQRLRKVLLPVQWMQESGLAVPDNKAKQDDSERRRIVAALEKLPKGSGGRAILSGYHKVLMENFLAGKTSLRSVRLALSPAASLLIKAAKIGCIPPDQKVLDAYLKEKPGQRAALSGFVRYMRETHNAQVTLPKIDAEKLRRSRRRKLEAELIALVRRGGEKDDLSQQWIEVALAYFHGLPRRIGRAVHKDQILQDGDDGLIVTLDGGQYWIPALAQRALADMPHS